MATDRELLEAALDHRLITRKQHQHILEELETFPGNTAEELLLKRQFLTEAQLERLKSEPIEDQPTRPIQAFQNPVPTPPASPPESSPAPQAPPVRQVPPAQTVQQARPADTPSQQPRTLKDMLRLARHWGCSDLHVSSGRPPFVRLNGQIRYMEMAPLSPEDAKQLNFSLLTEDQRRQLEQDLTLDFALDIPRIGRHRCNVFNQRLGWDGAYRIIPHKIPTFDELGLPPPLKMLTEYPQGLVLVTGPASSGKTTTIAAMLDLVNQSRDDHIITIEDPIEFIHSSKGCHVTQRQVGLHSESFGTALRASLREDPDILLVGEMRDLETISIAITAAETGHLVFGTLHTGSAPRTVSRILDVFPSNQQAQIAVMISESLRGVVSQQLIPRKDAQGLVLAMEILLVTSAVSALIRDSKFHQLLSVMQSGRRLGMQTMDDSLAELLKRGFISGFEAYRRSENKAAFEQYKSQT